jgi:hypothetical protein
MKSFSTSALQLICKTPSVLRDPRLGCVPIGLATPGEATPAMLITWAGDLVAILGEADSYPGPEDGTWYVEYGLGPCETPPSGLFFDTLDDAIHWAEVRCLERGGIGLA